uniref:Uncharacterized protein n=1 Tax=Timspurckia oligopyrenoides TaxID=708627 RepID=A0A6T6N687_9RHOD
MQMMTLNYDYHKRQRLPTEMTLKLQPTTTERVDLLETDSGIDSIMRVVEHHQVYSIRNSFVVQSLAQYSIHAVHYPRSRLSTMIQDQNGCIHEIKSTIPVAEDVSMCLSLMRC